MYTALGCCSKKDERLAKETEKAIGSALGNISEVSIKETPA
jgi:hypothetical protein